jgi:hypothetical protein
MLAVYERWGLLFTGKAAEWVVRWHQSASEAEYRALEADFKFLSHKTQK